MYIKRLPQLDIHAQKDNTGTIKFSGKPANATEENSVTSIIVMDFYDIPDVRDVFRLIQDLQQESQAIQDDEISNYEPKRKRYQQG